MKVRLRSRILFEIAHELGFGTQPFRQEEGGYLAGRFDGESIEIVSFWRDLHAQRSSASIKLREAHLDYVSERIKQSGDPQLYIVGTWHVHPTGYGTQMSPTDAEYLFLEHAAIRAGGLANGMLPQAHLILGWGDLYHYSVYTMQVQIAGLQFTVAEAQIERLKVIGEALQQSCNAGILLSSGETSGEAYSVEEYSGPSISEAFAAGTLRGFFWHFPYRSIDEDVERIYLANFIYHVQQGSKFPNYKGNKRSDNLIYYRFILSEDGPLVMAFRLHISLGVQSPKAFHTRSRVSEEITVLLSNPDAPKEAKLNFGAYAHSTMGDISSIVKNLCGLGTAPLLSTQRPLLEEAKWRRRTIMDAFGEILLPEDVSIAELLDDRSDGIVNISWRSTELHPHTIYDLRTQRLQGMGYDRNRLNGSSALVAGLGLLGSEMVQLFLAAGVGKLLLVDHGTVDFTNVYRQRLYESKDVYQKKVDAAMRRLSGAGVIVEGHHLSIPTVGGDQTNMLESLATLEDMVSHSNIVIGTLDSFSGRAVLQALCLRHRVPFLSVAVDQFEQIDMTQASIFLAMPDRPGCYACGRSLAPSRDSGVCTVAPIEFPPIASGLAFRLANEVLHGKVDSCRAMQIYSNLSVEEQEISGSDPQCEICGTDGLGRKSETHLYQRIQTWLQGSDKS